jgi:hypothetical protein
VLLEVGADALARDSEGRTPLEVARRQKHAAVAAMLAGK